MSDATVCPPTPTSPDTLSQAEHDKWQGELAHRFRHTLSTGHVSPLLHLILQYKLKAPPC